MDSNIVFDDMFTVSEVTKSFDRVCRLQARSENHEMDLTLDVNSDLYPLQVGDQFSLALASSLALNDTIDNNQSRESAAAKAANDRDVWRSGKGGLADDYEYVMHGKVYKFDDAAEARVSAFVSFGGLLMALSGDYRHLSQITIGQNIYLLMRR